MVAAGASALSLGGSRGTVVLGAPVDLAFDVQPDSGSDVASSCITAQVVAGDTPVGEAKVRVMPLPELRGRPAAVRVQAAIAVDEPVLTVTLSAGCSGKVTRTYTFLAELPMALPRSASPVDVARLPLAGATSALSPVVRPNGARPAAATAAAEGAPPAAATSVPDRPSAAPQPVAPRAAARDAARAPVQSARAAAAAKGPVPAQRPRLVIEPLDTWMERPLVLRPSSELLVPPSEQPSPQRTQAAALWKSLTMQPEELQQAADRQKVLETDVAALRAQTARDKASAAQLQQQLDQTREESFPASVVYGLGGLALAALALAAWAVVRMRSASDKAVRSWRDSVAIGARDAASDGGADLAPHAVDTWVPPDTAPNPVFSDSDPAAPAGPVTLPTATPAAASRPPATAAPRATAPVAAPVAVAPAPHVALHIVSPEELFDIQQQAEFFISVGEHQQAIEVLRAHIAERGDTSPLAYLELLKLYHTLSRADEFAQLRAQFMQSFNAQVPEFSSFHRTGRMLYHYTDALAQIEAEWTSPSVLALLEKLLFRQPDVEAVEPFDMAAYDDLLLLLAIAQTTPASARGEPPPRKRTTPLAPPRSESEVAHHHHIAHHHTNLLRAPAPDEAQPLDSLAASLEFDFGLMAPSRARNSEPADDVPAPAPLRDEEPPSTRGVPLDLDLTEPPHLTLSDLPPVPVTAPPPPGQAVGFGMDNDLVELRLELEQKKGDGNR